ncbi:serine hydrolase domain-containing protein [Chitinophaga polysaccharea]|uniref:serine hydrolase domain-containing protein n=1 Tax=Chitinophaga polysaccharea TaxID=1293035 RepID=UPI00115A6F47|nr:serine hydrolase domain-containing protein [Chitinophaga polysaccharea]
MKESPLLALLILAAFFTNGQNRSLQLQQLFDTLYAKHQFNGCVLVADAGKSVFQGAFGYADLDKKTLLDLDTRFEIASVAKQFTAMAIMQLKEQGKLQYSDSIGKYFPSLPYHEVTIRDLLHHTSGIRDFLGWTVNQIDTGEVHTSEDLIERLPGNIPATSFSPGTAFSYSNTNYVLLAAIVAKVSGMSFSDYMKENIFKKIGMTNTLVYSKYIGKGPLSNYAAGYAWDAGDNKFVAPECMMAHRYIFYLGGVDGAYGICSTVKDLLKWDQALYTEQLVSSATLEEAFTPQRLKDSSYAGFSESMPYGFGWILSADTSENTFVWHSGGFSGYTSLITRYTKRHLTVIVLQNIENNVSPNALMVPVSQILDQEQHYDLPEVPPLKRGMIVTAAQLQPFAGIYQVKNNPSVKMEISVRGNRLYAKYMEQITANIYPSSADTFFYTVIDATIKFKKENGAVYNQLTLFQNGHEMEMSRIQ